MSLKSLLEPDKARDLLATDLAQFTRSETHTAFNFFNRNIVCSDGVKYVGDHAGAYWLLDAIATLQRKAVVEAEEFQVWRLAVDLEKHSAVLTCADSNGNVIYTRQIERTDFPLAEITLWSEPHGTRRTLLLPTEHAAHAMALREERRTRASSWWWEVRATHFSR
jgi:hypothetical protein